MSEKELEIKEVKEAIKFIGEYCESCFECDDCDENIKKWCCRFKDEPPAEWRVK